MKLKVKNIIDVITNSSDETFLIKGQEDPEAVRNKLYKFLEYLGEYGTIDEPTFCGVFDADIKYSKENDGVLIDYPVLCNLEEPIKILGDLFGEGNIVDMNWRLDLGGNEEV